MYPHDAEARIGRWIQGRELKKQIHEKHLSGPLLAKDESNFLFTNAIITINDEDVN